MKMRDAILKAADMIESRPHLFEFSSLRLPDMECGTPGCALGWIAFYSGIDIPIRNDILNCDCKKFTGPYWPDSDLFDLLGIPNVDVCFTALNEFNYHWADTASNCADALRQFADKYHPAKHSTKHTGLPKSVRELFEVAA